MILGEKFWRRVVQADECWVWQGATSTGGYGQFWVGGRRVVAHRLSYEAAYGPIEAGLQIDHMCHNPPCVRPSHLQAVTPGLNQQNRAGAQINTVSGIRGVTRHRDRWQVAVRVNRQQNYGGSFKDVDEAAMAAKDLRNRLMTNNLNDR